MGVDCSNNDNLEKYRNYEQINSVIRILYRLSFSSDLLVMSRINTFKNSKVKDIMEMNEDAKFLAQKRSEKAREMRKIQFDKNREIPDLETKDTAKPIAMERSEKLNEWRKKKDLEKQNKVASKKPFLPSGPSNKLSSAAGPNTLHNSKTLHNSLPTNSYSKKTRHNNNPTTYTRVTRSQVRREKEENEAATTSLPLPSTKPTYVIDEQELAWIPENELGGMNLKVRRKSLRFSELFSNTARSPFVFKANSEVQRPPRATIPMTILEDSVEISPISSASVINRNLFGAFSQIADDTDILPDAFENEIATNDNEIVLDIPSKPLKEVKIQEPSNSLIVTPAPVLLDSENSIPSLNTAGIELYSSLLQTTQEDLMSQRNRWQTTLTTLTEACDSIRVAIGHTDLLLSKKFTQYAGLIQDANDNPGNLDLETRCSDLQGFWDLILREVEDMQAKYGRLIRLAENGYQAVKSTHKLDKKPLKKIIPKPKKESTRVTRSASISLREQMIRGREQMKEQQREPGVIIMTQQKN
ncbi:disks large-associated protein 1 isoform X1 [Oopsacas minuta]|uniref:Disks large-associated protein 1 isoform X1 n=1 Tax=Oopsacas minuta TaxID=111878 RepID=A0AAV7JAQ2_9METZ|nr:disks large-associated protein 1 isoform X1 [Oopsacas minuta]